MYYRPLKWRKGCEIKSQTERKLRDVQAGRTGCEIKRGTDYEEKHERKFGKILWGGKKDAGDKSKKCAGCEGKR